MGRGKYHVTLSQLCDHPSQMVMSQVTVCHMTRVTGGPWESKCIATVVKCISSRKLSENSIEFSLSNSEQRDSWLNSGHWTLDTDTMGVIPCWLTSFPPTKKKKKKGKEASMYIHCTWAIGAIGTLFTDPLSEWLSRSLSLMVNCCQVRGSCPWPDVGLGFGQEFCKGLKCVYKWTDPFCCLIP